jgi:hypothetical protein
MLQYPFKLSGKTDKLWREITNNEWNNMLPKHWIDKGFHFYKRIKERGPKVGINSPSDLSSEINNGSVSQDHGIRFRITTSIVSEKGLHFTIFYDFNEKKKLCELVTCSFE